MFTKILLTVAVVALIWFGFKYLQRVTEMREARERRQPVPPPKADGPSFRDEVKAADGVQDLVKCRVCDTFRAGNAGSCGRADCPY